MNILRCLIFLNVFLVFYCQEIGSGNSSENRADGVAKDIEDYKDDGGALPINPMNGHEGVDGAGAFQEKKIRMGGVALRAERAFALPGNPWKTRFGGTSVVVLTRKPLSEEKDQYQAVCKAWINNFALIGAGGNPLVLPWEVDRIMGFFWPLNTSYPDGNKLWDCDYLIDHYDFEVGWQLAHSVETSRGPLLVAWRRIDPEQRISMSLWALSSERSIFDAFGAWRSRIQLQPENWSDGFDITLLRVALRDFLNRYSDVLLCVVGDRLGRQCVKGGV